MPERKITADELAEFLGVLAHGDRVRIIEELRVRGSLEVKQLRLDLDIPPARLSQHLALLRHHRILRECREGRRVIYSLREGEIADWLLEGLTHLRHSEYPEAVARAKEHWTVSE